MSGTLGRLDESAIRELGIAALRELPPRCEVMLGAGGRSQCGERAVGRIGARNYCAAHAAPLMPISGQRFIDRHRNVDFGRSP